MRNSLHAGQRKRHDSRQYRDGTRKRPAPVGVAGRAVRPAVQRPADRTANPQGRRGSRLPRAVGSKQESRERLVGLFWSRSDEEKARASLRQVVRELRSVLEEAGYGGFVAERLMIGIDIGQVEVDIESVLQQAENERVHPLLLDTPQLDERLLEGMDDLDPSFRVWVLAKRQTIHERLMRNLDAGLTRRDVPADIKKRIAAAIVNLDPTHEHACRYLMRAHAEEGDIAGALRIYKALWELLDRDYGMEPSPATEELVASIKLGVLERPPAIAAASAENANSPSVVHGVGLQPLASSRCRNALSRRFWCCGPLRCTASTASKPSRAGILPSISPPVWCVSANGVWSIAFRTPQTSRPGPRRNIASRPPPIRRAMKSTS